MKLKPKALILVAGMASRLLPLTKTKHKALIVVGKYPLLWYSISNLLDIGINNICLVTGYKSKQIHEFVKAYFPEAKITFIYSNRFRSTNSIYSYYLARNFIKLSPFFRLEGDIFYTKSILEKLICSKTEIVSAVEKKTKKSEEEYSVEVGDNKLITKYGKDIEVNKAFGEAKGIEFISKKGSYKVVRSLESLIKKRKYNEYAEFCYQNLIDSGEKVCYLKLNGADYWCELDTPRDLNSIRSYLRKLNL